jgi:glyoxylase-like metal-dependent hydrolase (beta-lactamase superfamily II)
MILEVKTMVEKDTLEHPFKRTFIPVTSVTSGRGIDVTKDIYCLPIQIVNVCFLSSLISKKWVLIDAGMPHSADEIKGAVKNKFGDNDKPEAIILTHGHFDHVGALVELVEEWDVPVYAHQLELPYLTGKSNYPKGDSTVDGGLISEMSPMFPNHGIDLRSHVKPLPSDGGIPGLDGWRWIHTPGHTPGHVSFFNDGIGALIAGDAFVTVKQESLYKVIMQKTEISGPPKYFTTDWDAARKSVETLTALKPKLAITGHGLPMEGEELLNELEKLVENFDQIAIPEDGRFVN